MGGGVKRDCLQNRWGMAFYRCVESLSFSTNAQTFRFATVALLRHLRLEGEVSWLSVVRVVPLHESHPPSVIRAQLILKGSQDHGNGFCLQSMSFHQRW